MLHVMDDNP